jgi:membrane protease subunit HflK
MAWNESGGGDKDPWGNRGNNNDGPPDLDEAIRKLQGQLSGMFGGGGGGKKDGSSSSLSGGSMSLLVILALGLYAFAGVYQVDQQERGVIFRFGEVLPNEVGPGLHWNPPLIDQGRYRQRHSGAVAQSSGVDADRRRKHRGHQPDRPVGDR